jgi:periplasmic protein TonB
LNRKSVAPDKFTRHAFNITLSAKIMLLKYIAIFFLVLFGDRIFSQPQQITKDELDSLPFVIVDENPQFKGGPACMYEFVFKNLNYKTPECQPITGTAWVEFIVEKNGSLTNVKIKKGVSTQFDNEVLRVVSLMPAWQPGTKNGKPVRSIQYLPVKCGLR